MIMINGSTSLVRKPSGRKAFSQKDTKTIDRQLFKLVLQACTCVLKTLIRTTVFRPNDVEPQYFVSFLTI